MVFIFNYNLVGDRFGVLEDQQFRAARWKKEKAVEGKGDEAKESREADKENKPQSEDRKNTDSPTEAPKNTGRGRAGGKSAEAKFSASKTSKDILKTQRPLTSSGASRAPHNKSEHFRRPNR